MNKKKCVASYVLEPEFEGLDEMQRDIDRLESLLIEAAEVMGRVIGAQLTMNVNAITGTPGRKKGKSRDNG